MLLHDDGESPPPRFVPLWVVVGMVLLLAVHVYVYYHAARGDVVLGMEPWIATRVAFIGFVGLSIAGTVVGRRRWKRAQAAARSRRG